MSISRGQCRTWILVTTLWVATLGWILAPDAVWYRSLIVVLPPFVLLLGYALFWLKLQAKLNQGMALHRQGRLAEAEHIYGEVLRCEPGTLMRCICLELDFRSNGACRTGS